MGQRVWDDLADNDKIEREKKKYPAQETLGFRIIGMRVSTIVNTININYCYSLHCQLLHHVT